MIQTEEMSAVVSQTGERDLGEKEEDNWLPDARKLPSDVWKPR